MQQLTKFLPYILGGLGVLIAAIAASVFLIIKSSRKKQDPSQMFTAAMKQRQKLDEQFHKYREGAQEKAAGGAESMSMGAPVPPSRPSLWHRFLNLFGIHSGQLAFSFKEALKLLREKIPGRDYRYRVPWFLMIGEAGSGKTTVLDNVGLPQPFGRIGGDPFILRKAVTWWLFTTGIVLDVDGSMIAAPDGKTSDDAQWREFLALLRRSRPERPVDGIVITIPVDDLIGARKLSSEDLRRKADLLYDKIWYAQKATGMTFPVFIVVTKCDHISGFRSYASELPKFLQDDMFGWSNPYSVHAAYVSEWVDEAAANLKSTIYRTQIEIFAESEVVEDSDGVFLFPAEFQKVIEPLRIYLNHLFKESAHHESFLFRGIYFTGDAELDAPVTTEVGGEYTAAVATNPKPVFLKHLFEKKVFLEHPLARPVYTSLLARNRWALAGQLACVAFLIFGSLALWLSGHRLQRESDAFRPVLLDVERDLSQIRDVEKAAGQKLTPAETLKRLEGVDPTKILEGMQEINVGTLKTIWLPASWMNDLDDRLDEALDVTFSKVVLGSIYLDLTEHTQQTLQIEPPPPPADTTYRLVNVSTMPEFQTLRRFIDRIKELEEHLNEYNFEAMPDSGDLPTLGKLVKYVYGTELPQSFYQNSEFYLRALKASMQDVISMEMLKSQVAEKQDDLAQKFFDALLDRELPIAQLDELQAELDMLSKEPTTADSDAESYRALMGTIDQLSQTFARPELAWTGKMTFDPGPEYTQLLDSMQMSMLLGPAARMKLQDKANANFELIRSTLQNYQSSLTGPILQLADNTFKPSPPVVALRKGLEDFLNQRFMAQGSGRRIRAMPPPGSRFTWDLTGLQQALQFVEPYNAFVAGGLTSFRPELQTRLRLMALNRLEANMVSIISGAQHVDTALSPGGGLEQDVQNETKQLKDVSKPLTDLLSAFDRLAMTRAYADLADATLSNAFQHLRSVDQLLDQKAPYTFDRASLDRWEGAEPLAGIALGVKDDKEVPQYLEVQRDNMKHLKEYADPALAVINSQRASRRTPADAQLLAKCQGIAAELDKFDNKNPASNVSALEVFITSIPMLTIDNYADKITPQDVGAQSPDFFLNKRNELRREVYERFDAIATARVVRQYRELETSFNQKLAGKFPFVAGIGRGAEADPQSIRDFFKLFDANNKTIIKFLERPSARSASGTRVLQFVDDMAAVRTLFAPFLDDAKALAPVFDYEVEFRVNRRRETGGNQIIDWELNVGDQKITARDTMRRGRWVFGDAVRLSLRWAKDANIIPAAENTEGVVYEDRKVTFEETDRWAIFRFFRTHGSVPADFDQLVDPMPQTLKFIVPTMMTGDDPMQTRVFIRLTLLTADKKEPITLPSFPDRAPALDRT